MDAVDPLDACVLFLSTTESRNKLYRLLQYGAKVSKWTLMTAFELHPEDLRAAPPHKRLDNAPNGHVDTVPTQMTTTAASRPPRRDLATEKRRDTARRLAAMLARVEGLFGDARKVYRLFQFVEMLDLLRHVRDADPTVRILRRLRILCFFFFYLLENCMVYLLRVVGVPHRDPRVVFLKRACNGFWCLSIVLAFGLDRLLHRGGHLSTLKKLLDLPVAYLAFTDTRVSDGLFGLLGITSAKIGVYLRWVEVMAKARKSTTRVVQRTALTFRDMA